MERFDHGEQISSSRVAVPTVLLVQPSVAEAQLVQFALAESDVPVRLVVAHSLAEGLSQLRANPRPSLVLLDLELPDGSGLNLLTRLKVDTLLRHIPVLILTNCTSWDEHAQAIQLGAIDYWLKPSSFERLIDMMRRLRRYLPQPQGSAVR
jgi:DNA-binding response OmpR family regulator